MTEMTKGRIVVLMALLVVALSWMWAGGGYAAEEYPFVAMHRVGMIPLVPVESARGDGMVPGILGNRYFRSGALPAGVGEKVAGLVTRELRSLRRCDVVSLEGRVREVGQEALNLLAEDPLSQAVLIGKHAGVYGVVVGGVYRFEERQGSALGVQRPASVAFDLYLIRVEDKKVLWAGVVDRTQRALSENLLEAGAFFKGGGGWVTAETLAAMGLESVLDTFPYLRLE